MKIELMKKTLATIMALTVICGAQTAVTAYQPTVGITAVAADIVDSGTCGENVTYTLDSNGVLAISGEGEIKKGAFQGEYPPMGITAKYSNYEKINRIEIYNGVTAIGDAAFLSCYNVKSVSLPVTLETIGSSAFFRTGSLTSIMIPESVESIGRRAFYQSGIESITTFPRKVETIEYETFFDSGLKKISIPGSVKSIEEGAFSYCSDLESVTIWNPECEIADFAGTISNATAGPTEAEYDGVIRGYAGSTAQAYAEKYNRKFEVIEEISTETTTTTTSTTSTTTTQKPTTTSTASTTAPETTKTGEITVVASGKCGENAIWQLDSDGKMTISGEGAVSRPTEWYNAEIRNKVISLVIEDGITELGNQMFKGFENLETVSMPQNMLFISHYKGNNNGDTFCDCPKLNFGTCGPYITWKYDEETNSLFIDGKGTMQDYYYITAGEIMVAPWYHNRDNKIDKIFLSEDVERIGMCAFWGYGVSKRPEITVLNPECDVHWLIQHDQPVDENGNRFKLVSKIYGYENSTAQKFAIENNIPFESLDKATTTTTSTTPITTTTSTTSTTATSTTSTTTKATTTSTNTSTITSTTTVAVTTTTAEKSSFGDANGDGAINAVDASITLSNYARYATTKDKPTEYELTTQDVNGDGFVNAVDASTILSYYAYTSVGGKLSFPEYLKNPNSDPKETTSNTTVTTISTTTIAVKTTSTTTAKHSGTTTTAKVTSTTAQPSTTTTAKPLSTTTSSATSTSTTTVTLPATSPISTTTIINPKEYDWEKDNLSFMTNALLEEIVTDDNKIDISGFFNKADIKPDTDIKIKDTDIALVDRLSPVIFVISDNTLTIYLPGTKKEVVTIDYTANTTTFVPYCFKDFNGNKVNDSIMDISTFELIMELDFKLELQSSPTDFSDYLKSKNGKFSEIDKGFYGVRYYDNNSIRTCAVVTPDSYSKYFVECEIDEMILSYPVKTTVPCLLDTAYLYIEDAMVYPSLISGVATNKELNFLIKAFKIVDETDDNGKIHHILRPVEDLETSSV